MVEKDTDIGELVQGGTEIILREMVTEDVSVPVIAALKEKAMAIRIVDINDKENYDLCHSTRMVVKNLRIAVTKRGEKLRAGAVEFSKNVIKVQKDILARIEPIETYLDDEESRIDNEKERIKKAEDDRLAAILQTRVNKLFDLGCRFDGSSYIRGNKEAPLALVKSVNDEQFETFAKAIQADIDAEVLAKAEEERKLKEEQTRLEEVAKKQKEESDRLAAEGARIAAEAKALQDEKDRIAREAREAEDKKAREEELAKARSEEKVRSRQSALTAVQFDGVYTDLGKMSDEDWERLYREAQAGWTEKEKTRIQGETEARMNREAEEKRLKEVAEAEEKRLKEEAEAKEKADKEKKAADKAARKEARRPDKEKLQGLVDYLRNYPSPVMRTEDGQAVLAEIEKDIDFCFAAAAARIEQL